MIQVFENKLKLYLLEDIKYENILEKISSFLDSSLCKEEEFLKKHISKDYKDYTFNYLYPLELDKIYRKNNIYTLTIRTISLQFAKFINETLVNHYNESFKALSNEIRIIPRKYIEKIYSITPLINKNDNGYWKKDNSLNFFEERFKANSIKKLKMLKKDLDLRTYDFYNEIKFKNHKPIAVPFKNIKLLGDKIELSIESDELSQELAYLLLGVGALENNTRGFGFMNFRWL